VNASSELPKKSRKSTKPVNEQMMPTSQQNKQRTKEVEQQKEVEERWTKRREKNSN
jgi:hypothetical protein